MNAVAAWSRRLAEQMAPAESGSAERIGAAYLAGGRRRRDLLRRSGSEAGGFGAAAGAGELPIILDGLRYVADHLLDLLSGHPLADLLVLLAIRRATVRGGPREQTAEAPLDQVIGAFDERLRAQGVAPERARELTYDTLKLIFQHDRDAEEIDAFLRALAGSPPAEPMADGAAVGAARERLPATRGGSTGWMLPPWLWLYFLGVAAPAVPDLIAGFRADVDGMSSLVGYLTSNARSAATAVLTGAGLLELFPALLLLAGIAGVLFPGARGRWAERRHRLEPDDGPLIAEMSAYVRRHVPAVELRLGERHDRLARVYPVGRRSARIAVYPPLLRLWAQDREAARAVLLHEVAHVRQGDHLIVGLASPFGWFVRVWGVTLTILVLLPVTFYTATGGPGSTALLASLLYDAAAIPIGLILPVAGLWVAELSADRLALQEARPGALLRALGPAPTRRRLIGRLLDGLTHPPLRLRRWAAGAWPGGTAAVAALWPAAVVARIAAITVVQVLLHLLTGTTVPEGLGMALDSIQAGLVTARATLVEMTVLLVNWPLLAPLWMRIWTPVRTARQRFAPYLLSALIPGTLVTGGLATGTAAGSPAAAGSSAATATPLTPAVTDKPAPDRTGAADNRPWTGQALPVHLRITAFTALTEGAGPAEWKGVAAGWLGGGVWRAEKDGRLSFGALAGRPDLRPGPGHWLRIGDVIAFWLPVERDVDGTPVATQISGEVDLTRDPATMEAVWGPVVSASNGSSPGSVPVLRITAPLDVYSAP